MSSQHHTQKIGVYVLSTLKSHLLEETLASVIAQETPDGFCLAEVVLVINAADPEVSRYRFDRLKGHFAATQTALRIVNERTIGIPYARNAALRDYATSNAEWMVFLDDDCIAQPGWLKSMCSAASHYGSDAVASKWSIVPESLPSAFLPPSTWGPRNYRLGIATAREGDTLRHAYTRSVMLRTSKDLIHRETLYFDTGRNLLGGSDVVFFEAFRSLGFMIIFTDGPGVVEFYGGNRVRYAWHYKRKMRNIQFILERSRAGEVIEMPWTIVNLLVAALMRIAGAHVALLKAEKRKTSIALPRLHHIGQLGFHVAHIVGIVRFLLGSRVQAYKG